MDKQTRIRRIVTRFLGGRFSAATEERVQRWMVEERDEAEKEAASLEFWRSLGARHDLGARRSWQRVAARVGLPATRRMNVRRWAGIAAAVLVPLAVVAGGLVWRAEVKRAEAERIAVETAAAEAARLAPLEFEGASVDEIFTALEERFDVAITADEAFRNRPGDLYTVKFPKGDSLDNILDVLRDVIGEFEYTKTGNHITITAK